MGFEERYGFDLGRVLLLRAIVDQIVDHGYDSNNTDTVAWPHNAGCASADR